MNEKNKSKFVMLGIFDICYLIAAIYIFVAYRKLTVVGVLLVLLLIKDAFTLYKLMKKTDE